MLYSFLYILAIFFIIILVVTVIMIIVNITRYKKLKNNVFTVFDKDSYTLNDVLVMVMRTHENYVKEQQIADIKVSEIKTIKAINEVSFACLITTLGKKNKKFDYTFDYIDNTLLVSEVNITRQK